MPPVAAIILGSIATIVLTVLLYIKVLPRKMDGALENPFLQFLHDFFHFKKLYLEEVLRFIFTLATVACIAIGAFLLITVNSYDGYYYSYSTWYGGYGLLLMIGGPIFLRLVYEGFMMAILLVKNTIEINSKLKKPEAPAAPAPEAPAAPAPEAPAEPAPETPAE